MNTIVSVLADANDGWDHMWGGGWMWLWGTIMMTFWIAVIAVAVWAVVRRPERRGGSDDRAREILAERYARGEISTEEYQERIENLR